MTGETGVFDSGTLLYCTWFSDDANDCDAEGTTDGDADDDADGDADDGIADGDAGRLRNSESTIEGKSIDCDSTCSWEPLNDGEVDEDDE